MYPKIALTKVKERNNSSDKDFSTNEICNTKEGLGILDLE